MARAFSYKRIGVALIFLGAVGALVGYTALPYPGLRYLVQEFLSKRTAAPSPRAPREYRDPEGARIVVVMIFDGLAPAMIRVEATPTLDRLRREGAFIRELAPVFPTLSLPSGVSISTGCEPGRHGIVANRFLDPERGLYRRRRIEADWTLACEGLHEVAERQGVRTAALGWYASLSPTRGELAHVVRPWDHAVEDERRAEEVAELLALPESERPRLVLAYLRGPDHVAHLYGMHSPAVSEAVRSSDRAVGIVVEAIERLGLRDRVALVVATDHGMLVVSHMLNIHRILGNAGIEATVLAMGSVAYVYLDDPSDLDGALARLSGRKEFDVFSKYAQPAWSHLGTGPRVGDLIVSAHPPYVIHDRGLWPWQRRWRAWLGPEVMDLEAGYGGAASHGYPPDTPGVAGFLEAWGSGIAAGREVPAASVLDIHPTVARLLGIEPGAPVDGRAIEALFDSGTPPSPP